MKPSSLLWVLFLLHVMYQWQGPWFQPALPRLHAGDALTVPAMPGERQDRAHQRCVVPTPSQHLKPLPQGSSQMDKPLKVDEIAAKIAFIGWDLNWSTLECIRNNSRRKQCWLHLLLQSLCPHLHWLQVSKKGQNSLIFFCTGQKGMKTRQQIQLSSFALGLKEGGKEFIIIKLTPP